MKRFALILTLVLVLALTVPASAADTTNTLSGVVINEILIDPNSTLVNFDTDGNGTVADWDEFVELYNLGAAAVDISGWQLWDAGTGLWFTFPGAPGSNTTVLQPGAYAVVVVGVQAGGSLPTMTNPNSLAFDAGRTSGVINNGGDNAVLLDTGTNAYIQILFNGDTEDTPQATYVGFPAAATRSGVTEDFGSDTDGVSITRYPSGDTNIGWHTSTPGGDQASPTAIELSNATASSSTRTSAVVLLGAAVLLSGGLLVIRRRRS